MKLNVSFSTVIDKSIVRFNSLNNYFECISFLDKNNLTWEPLKYSAKFDTASIRVDEYVLNVLTEKYKEAYA